MQQNESTAPFWLGDAGADGLRRLGLSEAWLETIEGDVVGLELVAAGTALRRGDALGLLHTSRRAYDLRLPAAMRIAKVNAAALANPALVRRAPYGAGWLAEVETQ